MTHKVPTICALASAFGQSGIGIVRVSGPLALDVSKKILKNYNLFSIQGKLHREKDKIANEMVRKMYMSPHYISPCHAGSLFGIISIQSTGHSVIHSSQPLH